MICDLKPTGRKDGERFVFLCPVCEHEVRGKCLDAPPKRECLKVKRRGQPPLAEIPPPPGPGTELSVIFAELGINPNKQCGCKAKAAQMDRWGVVGCQEHREEILVWMKEAYDASSLTEWLSAGVSAFFQGGPKSLAGLLDLAISRCAELRIAFLTPGLNMGGAERWLASLCRHFDRSKILPAYVVVKDTKGLAEETKAWFPADTRIVLNFEQLPQVLKYVDLLVSWGPVDLDTLTKGARIPIVDACHGTLGHWDGQTRDGYKVQEQIARQAIAAGAHLAAVSEECLANYPEEYRGKVTVIPNGAEVERVQSALTKEEAKAKCGIADWQKMVLFLGRFHKEKNLQALVDAMDCLPGWVLVAAGPQHEMPQRTEGKPILFPGVVDPPGDLLRAADVLCMPSLHEAHSLTLIEGNLAGVPVVSYNYPAMRHLTAKHGPLATLVPPKCSAEELATAIELAATADASRIREIAEENYTAAKMAARWQDYLCSKATAK